MSQRTSTETYLKLRGLDDFYNIVKKFHIAGRHPAGEVTQVLTGKEKMRRAAWMQEELNEFIAAKCLVDQCDALGDLLWFVIGTMVCMGVAPSDILGPITTANMAKIGLDGYVKYRESDGKIQKPEGWVPPEDEIAENLIERYHVQDPNQMIIDFE